MTDCALHSHTHCCIPEVDDAERDWDQAQSATTVESSQPQDSDCSHVHSLNEVPIFSSTTSAPNAREHSLAGLLQFLTPQVSLVLENTGSVARDHLASERTWLAYVRTSLAIAGTGVALVQLFTIAQTETHPLQVETGRFLVFAATLQHFAWLLGGTTISLAFVVLGIGVLRYFTIQKAMTQGMFPVARKTVVMITASLAALMAVTFGVLISLPS